MQLPSSWRTDRSTFIPTQHPRSTAPRAFVGATKMRMCGPVWNGRHRRDLPDPGAERSRRLGHARGRAAAARPATFTQTRAGQSRPASAAAQPSRPLQDLSNTPAAHAMGGASRSMPLLLLALRTEMEALGVGRDCGVRLVRQIGQSPSSSPPATNEINVALADDDRLGDQTASTDRS